MTKTFLFHLNSATFLEFLTRITGIENLIADSFFEGSGMHQIVRGGKLGVHADFNRHPRNNLDRRLNVLIYLNKDWDEAYGGGLELWDAEMKQAEVVVAPIFNRMVIFSTTDTAFHGHPDALMCPPGVSRKSLALYYYTNGRPVEEVSATRTTAFVARPGETFKSPLSLPERAIKLAKAVAKDVLPPVVTRIISRVT